MRVDKYEVDTAVGIVCKCVKLCWHASLGHPLPEYCARAKSASVFNGHASARRFADNSEGKKTVNPDFSLTRNLGEVLGVVQVYCFGMLKLIFVAILLSFIRTKYVHVSWLVITKSLSKC